MLCGVAVIVVVAVVVVVVVVVVVAVVVVVIVKIVVVVAVVVVVVVECSGTCSCLSIYLSICPSARLKTKLFCETSSVFELDNIKNAAILRLPQFLNLTTSKAKQFCETSSFFEVGNIRNKAILRDFLQKWKIECRADNLVPICFVIFPLHLSKVLRLPQKNEASSYKVLRLSRQNHPPKTEDLMLQNATCLRKSASGSPNISDEHVSCTAPAPRNASLQILCKSPTPAMVFHLCLHTCDMSKNQGPRPSEQQAERS